MVPHGEPSEHPCVVSVPPSVLGMMAVMVSQACLVCCSRKFAAATYRRTNRRVTTLAGCSTRKCGSAGICSIAVALRSQLFVEACLFW